MRCIFFTGEVCEAKPIANARFNYTPTDQEKEDLCNNQNFPTCQRLLALLSYVKASQKI